MGWSRAVASAVLAAAGFADLVLSQGYYGGDQTDCPTARYLGCFQGDLTSNIPFAPLPYTSGNPSYNYPDFSLDVMYNNTVTPLTCFTVCRGHGFAYSYMNSGNCHCGMLSPYYFDAVLGGNCTAPCGADSTQTCGGFDDAGTDVYADPSFADPVELDTIIDTSASLELLASQYKYLGCFYLPNFPTADSNAGLVPFADSEQCFEHCASLGYPLADGVYDSESSSVLCTCGQEFGYGSYQVKLSDASGRCQASCSSGETDVCDPTTEVCCGSANYYPVYINKELTGCYTPQIPGYGPPESGEYICAPSPAASLVGGPTSLTTASFGALETINTKPAPTHPLSVVGGGSTYYMYGCYGDGPESVLYGSTSNVGIMSATIGGLGYCAGACAGSWSYFAVASGR
ncbi:hypothetical protein NKR23_g2021 [Pleurostoma richardsiae]|uniref:WSC domain-containing protein n=1 Tax=Pleurostoma richardsiae TaxID=41990 RepID=A0AA38VJI2_9PEZI|nr:hypothetical protein NKR23_g2021 [Pleurostoma richardsiae]